SELDSPANPFEFDYKRFLSFNNIYHQHFINSTKKLVLQQRESKKDILFYSYKARLWARDQLLTFIPGIKEQAIAMALVLGVKDGIDNELQRAYASSGAMHVLAVSGLHVGIIYGLILLLFKPIQHKAGARWIVAATSIILLWIYAFITGLSPSVLRAVTMFSFMAIARPFGRATNIYNTLAGSAFLLLIFNPFLIMSVGFQLSYLAVLGIVTIHQPLYMLIEPRHRILDWVWNISCVSIAAQLATFSLGILYFHQFPTYFLVSNLFVIPGAVVILIGGVVLLAVSVFTPVALLVGKLLQYFIHILNEIVFAVEGLPFSLIEHIYLTTFQCWLLIGILVAIILLLQFKKFAALVGCAIFALVFSISQWLHFHTEVKGDWLIVYNIPGHTVIEWMSNGSSTFISDTSLISDEERIRFHITPNRLHRGVSKVEIKVLDQSVSQGVKVWDYRGNTIGIVSAPVTSWPEELALDYLIVSNNAFKSFEEASNLINFKTIILDSSNKWWLASKFVETSLSEIVNNVAEDGAFEINL
ncbi:MAG: ComEC/Rec2 family competence protein, partial [Cyclobacteriaceae bacterium]